MSLIFDPPEETAEKLLLLQKEIGEMVQKSIVQTIERADPDAAVFVDQAINSACNLAESVGNVLRQQGKYPSPIPMPFPYLPYGLTRDDSAPKRVGADDCDLADHLFRDGSGVGATLYSHHAIYVGNGNVLHYANDSYGDICIHESTFEEFAEGYPVYRMSRAESPLRYSPEEAVRRARSREWEMEYNLLVNNCENFVRWCRCGRVD